MCQFRRVDYKPVSSNERIEIGNFDRQQCRFSNPSLLFCGPSSPLCRIGCLLGSSQAFADEFQLDIKQNELRRPNKNQTKREDRDSALPPMFFLFIFISGIASGGGAWLVCR